MDKRFTQYLDSDALILSTFLDPRYQDSLFDKSLGSSTSIANIQRKIVEEVKNRKEMIANETESVRGNLSSSESEVNETTQKGSSSSSSSTLESFDFDSCFNMMIAEATAESESKTQLTSEAGENAKEKEHSGSGNTMKRRSSSTALSIEKEVATYLSFNLCPKNENPTDWWKINKNSLPHLSAIANKFLSAPPSSIESERVFSIGGNVYTPHRNSLKPEVGEKLMFINYNLRIMNFTY